MDNEFEEIIEDEQDPNAKKPALISDPVVGRVGDQERFERQKATIERSRRLMQRGEDVTAKTRESRFQENQKKYLVESDEGESVRSEKTQKQNTPVESSGARAVGRGEVPQIKQPSPEQNQVNEQSPQTRRNVMPPQGQKPLETEDELNFTSIFLLIGTALFFDVLQAICNLTVVLFLVGEIVTFFAFMTFWFWFRTKGIKFNTKIRSFSFAGAGIVELIPFLNVLPGWTLAVTVIILTTKGKRFAKLIPGGEKLIETATKISK